MDRPDADSEDGDLASLVDSADVAEIGVDGLGLIRSSEDVPTGECNRQGHDQHGRDGFSCIHLQPSMMPSAQSRLSGITAAGALTSVQLPVPVESVTERSAEGRRVNSRSI